MSDGRSHTRGVRSGHLLPEGTGPDTYRHEVFGPDAYSQEGTGSDTYRYEVSGPDHYSYEGTGPDTYRLEVSGTDACIHGVRCPITTRETIRTPTATSGPVLTHSHELSGPDS